MPMHRSNPIHHHPGHPLPSLRSASLLFACGLLACTATPQDPFGETTPRAAQDEDGESPESPSEGESISRESLPTLGADEVVDTFMQRLPTPTPLGENMAVSMRLPAPANAELLDSHVRVFGGDQHPILTFRTDVLVELGVLPSSPGPDFFTAFVTFDASELEQRLQTEQALASRDGVTEHTLVFKGRSPFAITTGVALDPDVLEAGGPVALGPCPVMPSSEQARWNESLLITEPAVVQDPARTHDFCGPGGNPDGVWTFKHLMEEMATGSGSSTHDFVVAWLSNWLNDVTVNGDLIPARTQMFDEVIAPWANQSGVVANLVDVGGTNVLDLSGDLDLDIAPFRLSAIVNRIDLGDTVTGSGGYGGGTTTDPADAGELRFIFGPQNLDTCQQLTFSVIFEYGVPIEGCAEVRDWALDWTELNDASALPPFSPAWLNHLESLTETVVVHGAAPGRGNDNAINQIRTNEFAFSGPWEFREFTLTTEDLLSTNATPPGTPDTPASGLLQPHTVAMTPDDTAFNPPAPSAEVDDFVQNFVVPTVTGSGAPGDCAAKYVVPADHPSTGVNFRGGNAFTLPPTHWEANVGATPAEVCGRHQFSLNTCNGCHFGDTNTPFLHVDPTHPSGVPATLSDFLTGGTLGIWSVPDSQFGTPSWNFADLDRRFNRLYDIACAQCGVGIGLNPAVFDVMLEMFGVVPIDVGPGIEPPFPTGPITEPNAITQLLEMRHELAVPDSAVSLNMEKMVREVEIIAPH